jgi:hypothetical protein
MNVIHQLLRIRARLSPQNGVLDRENHWAVFIETRSLSLGNRRAKQISRFPASASIPLKQDSTNASSRFGIGLSVFLLIVDISQMVEVLGVL